MSQLRLTNAEQNALAGGLVLVAIVGGLAFYMVEWLGLGLLGLIGLVVTNKFELFEDTTIGAFERGSCGGDLLSRQAAADGDRSPEGAMRRAAVRERRSQMVYLVNTLWIGLTTVGLGKFLFQVL